MNDAYVDYAVPIHLSVEQIQAMDQFYDVDLGTSVVALAGSEAVGMALLSRRDGRAWISGVGVVPDLRRRGIGRAMAGYLLDMARKGGAREVSLEVIAQNRPALGLYLSLGFQPLRELLTWRRPAAADPLPIPQERLVQMLPGELLDRFDAWHETRPSWQREATTLRKMSSRMRGYRLDWQEMPAAYCLVGASDSTLSLMDVGIDPATDVISPGRVLLQALIGMCPGQAASILNVSADDPLCRVLAALGFLVTVRQFEMTLSL